MRQQQDKPQKVNNLVGGVYRQLPFPYPVTVTAPKMGIKLQSSTRGLKSYPLYKIPDSNAGYNRQVVEKKITR